jgi:hypothetical protein
MMTDRADIDLAERLSRRRARIFTVMGVYFVAAQAVFLSNVDASPRVSNVKVAAWLVWAVTTLAALAFAGGHFRGAKIRALVEDEVSRANRGRAYETGFWAAAGMAILLYVVTMFEPVSGRDAIHLILTALVGAALIRFGALERRALRDG